MNTRKLTSVLAGSVLLLGALACGANGDNGEVDTGTNPGVAAEASQKAEKPALAPMNGKATTTLDKTLSVALSAPSGYKPGQYSITTVPNGGKAFGFTVTVTNVGDQPFDLNTVSLATLVGKDGAAGEPIFDSAQKYSGPPEAPLQPGKKATFKYGFVVPTKDTSEIQVTVSSYVLGQTATFTGTL